MKTRRVLMLACTWPPLVKAGTHRPLRLATRLADYNWLPTILTPALTRSPYEYDLSLDFDIEVPKNVQVIRPSQRMPRWRLRRRLGQMAELLGQKRLFEAFTNRVLIQPSFFPEWTKGALLSATEVHLKTPFDVVWVTGSHWGLFPVAKNIATMLGLPLVLDYRDPWTANPDAPKRSGIKHFYHRQLETECLKSATGVSFVHPRCLEENQRVFGQPKGTIWRTIYNGYVERTLDLITQPTARPTLIHGGNCYAGRSAVPILEALQQIPATRRPDVKFFGALDRQAIDWLKSNRPPDGFEQKSLIPSQALFQQLKNSAAQILLVGPEHAHAVPSKIFDYMQVGRPVLGIGPSHAEVRNIIEECGLGIWRDSRDTAGIREAIELAESGEIPFNPKPNLIARYSAERMTRDTADLLDEVVATKGVQS